MSDSPQRPDRPSPAPWLRRWDQAVIAVLVVAALGSTAAYWFGRGGHRGELIEIERLAPRDAAFRVDVNTADWPELVQLPRVGEVLAKRIVESREDDGPYQTATALLRVKGIGPRTLETIQPYLAPFSGEPAAGGE